MPKAERGSLKDIGKRIKMKGLQKLKYYCQVCEKQCRDSNGFKCHITSSNHLQQMKIFSNHTTQIMDQYSKQFEKNFISTLRLRHSTSKVAANTVYQEMIQDKQHIHMNATIWTTLSDFVKYLGKTGQCIVEDTSDQGTGWYITYIERDVKKLAHIEQTQRRIQDEMIAEIEYNTRIEQQRMAAAMTTMNAAVVVEPTKLERNNVNNNNNNNKNSGDNHDGTTNNLQIQFSLQHRKAATKPSSTTPMTTTLSSSSSSSLVRTKKKSVFDDDDDDENDDSHQVNPSSVPLEQQEQKQQHRPPTTGSTDRTQQGSVKHASVRVTTADTTAISPVSSKNKQFVDYSTTNNNNNKTSNTDNNDTPPWLYPNIMVRIIHKTLSDGLYYRRKGHVLPNTKTTTTDDPYVARVQLLSDDNDNNTNYTNSRHRSSHSNTTDSSSAITILQLDQDDLETIGPKHIYDRVCIVRGQYSGYYGIVQDYDKKKYQATIELQLPPQQKHSTVQQQQQQSRLPIVLHNVDYDEFSKLYEP